MLNPEAQLKQAQINDANLALAGLRELGQVVLDSGVPQAAFTFAVSYKLLSGIASAGDEAKEELQVNPY